MSSKNNVCIYFDAIERQRIKLTHISDILSIWGTQIKHLNKYSLTAAIQFVLYVALLSKKIVGMFELSSSLMQQGPRVIELSSTFLPK